MGRVVGGLIACLFMLLLALPARAADQAVELRVMIFNIWLGGDQVNFARVLDGIRAAKADVVLLQEPDGATRRIAEALGWPYASERHHIISQYPLYEPPGGVDDFVYAELQPGRFVALADIHLTSDPYGPYAVREGKTADEVIALEQETRLPEIQVYIDMFTKVAAEGVPVIIGGDFNAPSHLDWTEAVTKGRAQVRYALEWPVTSALAAAGFHDSYRDAHPDPVAKPGITWTYGYPYPHLAPDEMVDRIDQIHALGSVTTLGSEIVGETGTPDADIGISPWPSDHRAVVSSFELVPGRAPSMVSLDRRAVTVGDPLDVRFSAAGSDDGRIEDGSIAIVEASRPASPLMTMTTNDGTDRQSLVMFGTASLRPGAYEAVLLSAEGAELARAPFWMQAPGAVPSIVIEEAALASGTITARFHNAPGNRRDWLGLYAAREADQRNYIAFIYTGGAIEGAMTFDEGAIGHPLDPGRYEIRLMRDDGYMTLAVTPPFEVK
jgi:endonuclease/exonuclease/phosphatase family metal-dependent hydrolase